jgi:hypothetical protein
MTLDTVARHRDSSRILLVGYVAIPLVGILHRGALFHHYFDDFRALVRAHTDWLTWQYLSLPALYDHFWSSILYLQQTPPIPNLILGAFLHAFGWPFGVAYACIALQSAISIASAMLLFGLLCQLTRPSHVYCAIALGFLLSTDLIVLEYNSLGQTFYENLTMLWLLLLVDAFVRLRSSRNKPRILVFIGLLTACLALTRASFSYFFVIPLLFLAAGAVPKRQLLFFLSPVVLLHGGWMLKNYAIYDTLSPSTSSWQGMNFANGLLKAGQGEAFRASILSDRERTPLFFSDMIEQAGLVHWHTNDIERYLPSDVRQRDQAIQEILAGTNRPENSIGQRLVSDLYMQAYLRYLRKEPSAILSKFMASYTLFWQPIRNYGIQFLDLFFVEPVVLDSFRIDRILAGFVSGALPERQYVMLEVTPREKIGRPGGVFSIPYFPTVMLVVNILVIHVGLPVLLAIAVIGRRRPMIPLEVCLIATILLYVAFVYNLAEHLENMRFRLDVEPLIWVLSIVTLVKFGEGRLPCTLETDRDGGSALAKDDGGLELEMGAKPDVDHLEPLAPA